MRVAYGAEFLSAFTCTHIYENANDVTRRTRNGFLQIGREAQNARNDWDFRVRFSLNVIVARDDVFINRSPRDRSPRALLKNR